MLYEIVPECISDDSACLQGFSLRKGAERTRTAVSCLTADLWGSGR